MPVLLEASEWRALQYLAASERHESVQALAGEMGVSPQEASLSLDLMARQGLVEPLPGRYAIAEAGLGVLHAGR